MLFKKLLLYYFTLHNITHSETFALMIRRNLDFFETYLTLERGLGAVAAQNRMIKLFHGVYGIDLANVWNGQKYALMKLGLIASPFTIAQEMDSLTDAAKARIDNCLAQFKTELD